ncbi:hypothetical protein GSI_03392 [Ganoderma sinense ZZ0214-1]|uniref:Transporter n=1 Tax=Ganoderma sinense ZZ0214-1 TaxID=1077348 RepID=A0A2G8SLK8_9APHY|nr:hypothetical protein GSI_03392 [Ganoderma sinense ZZ0214-1]
MTLYSTLLYLISLLRSGIAKCIQKMLRDDAPELSDLGSQKAVSVQTDLHQAETEWLRAALEDKEREMRSLEKKEQGAVRRARTFQVELETVRQRLKKFEADYAALQRRTQQTETRLSEAEDRVKHSEATVIQLGLELRRSESERQKTATLLHTRSAELRDAQAYLSKLDDVADAEVLQLVDGINSRIFQTAANIANAFQLRYAEQKDAQVSEEAVTRLRAFLGDSYLLVALRFIHHAGDPLIVQTALQACMVSWSRWLCVTWDFHMGNPPCLLQHVYQSIRRTGTYLQVLDIAPIGRSSYIDENQERQSVAGRWRALSRMYVKTLRADDAERQRIASNMLVDHITDVLIASGIGMPRQDLREKVENSYADALREVVHQSLEFQWIAGERIVSRDLFVFTALPGEPFNPSHMVDEWANPKRARHGVDTHPVLCTTQLGLVREEKKAPTEGADGEEGITKVVLLKPKVVLTSLLEELSNEQDRVACKT